MLMIDFSYHEIFEREFKRLEKKIPNLKTGFESFKLLAEKQFNPINPNQVIAPAKIHRVKANAVWVLWKAEMVVKNLKPNLFPRIWFAVKGKDLIFLSIVTHSENYEDNEVTQQALSRASDFF